MILLLIMGSVYLISLHLSVRFIKVFGLVFAIENRLSGYETGTKSKVERNQKQKQKYSINVMAVIIRRIQWSDYSEVHFNGRHAEQLQSNITCILHHNNNLFAFFSHFWQWLHLSYFFITSLYIRLFVVSVFGVDKIVIMNAKASKGSEKIFRSSYLVVAECFFFSFPMKIWETIAMSVSQCDICDMICIWSFPIG